MKRGFSRRILGFLGALILFSGTSAFSDSKLQAIRNLEIDSLADLATKGLELIRKPERTGAEDAFGSQIGSILLVFGERREGNDTQAIEHVEKFVPLLKTLAASLEALEGTSDPTQYERVKVAIEAMSRASNKLVEQIQVEPGVYGSVEPGRRVTLYQRVLSAGSRRGLSERERDWVKKLVLMQGREG